MSSEAQYSKTSCVPAFNAVHLKKNYASFESEKNKCKTVLSKSLLFVLENIIYKLTCAYIYNCISI